MKVLVWYELGTSGPLRSVAGEQIAEGYDGVRYDGIRIQVGYPVGQQVWVPIHRIIRIEYPT